MSKKPHFSSEFLLIISPCIFALASCGGSSPEPKQEYIPPQPDASIVYVYVTLDAAPTAATTCACVCVDPCTCSCDCGTGQPIAVLMPGCIPTVNDDAAPSPPPVVADAAPPSPDAPIVPIVVDAAAPDAPTIADSAPNKGPDMPPPDNRPCTTATCRCPANSVCKSTPLMSLPGISDYASLGHNYYVGVQSGFGIYKSDPADTYGLVGTLQVTALVTLANEVDVTYNAVGNSTVITTANVKIVYYDWFSLLRQLTAPIDACGCTGLVLDLKGNISSPRPEATMRITLADTICKNADGSPVASDGGTGSDEQWWYDIVQTDIPADWKTLQIPINSFRLGSVRYNDGKLDLRCLSSFELNYQYNVQINCTNTCVDKTITTGTGHFEVRNLTTY